MLELLATTEYLGGNGRTHVSARNYMEFLDRSCREIKERHVEARGSVSTVGINAMRHILGSAHIEEMFHMDSDFQRYMYLTDIRERLEDIISPNDGNGRVYREAFCTGPGTILEAVVPIQCEDYQILTPFDQGWEGWKNAQALRLLNHDSPEYTLMAMTDRLRFYKDSPTYAIFGIDIVILVLQWFHYCLDKGISGVEDEDPAPFLHDYVTVWLVTDAQDIWIRNRAHDLITDSGVSDPEDFVYNASFGYVGKRYPAFKDCILKIKTMVENRNLRAVDAFSSIPMPRGDYSSWLINRMRYAYIPNYRQFLWMKYLRDMEDIRLLFTMHGLQPKSPSSVSFRRMVYRELKSMKNSRFWDNCRQGDIREIVEQDFMTTFETAQFNLYADTM